MLHSRCSQSNAPALGQLQAPGYTGGPNLPHFQHQGKSRSCPDFASGWLNPWRSRCIRRCPSRPPALPARHRPYRTADGPGGSARQCFHIRPGGRTGPGCRFQSWWWRFPHTERRPPRCASTGPVPPRWWWGSSAAHPPDGPRCTSPGWLHRLQGFCPPYQRRLWPWPLTVRMPSNVVAVIPSRWAVAMSFFICSVTGPPHTTRTRERRSRSRPMSMPLLCSSGTASLRNRGRYSVGQMGEKPASYTARQYLAACSVISQGSPRHAAVT